MKIYAGTDADFTLYDDDGMTYAYENSQATKVTRLHWDNTNARLSHEGAVRWNKPDSEVAQIVGK